MSKQKPTQAGNRRNPKSADAEGLSTTRGATLARDKRSSMAERIATRLQNARRATQAALADTTFTTREAAIAEWLAVEGDFSDLRDRFPHRLAGVDTATLEKVRGLVMLIARGLEDNQSAMLGDLTDVCEHVLLGNENQRVLIALTDVENAASNIKTKPDAGAQLLYLLVRLDHRFATLSLDSVGEVLQKIKGKRGGREQWGPRTALAKLMAACGAFNQRTEGKAKKKIENALTAKSNTKKKLSRNVKR